MTRTVKRMDHNAEPTTGAGPVIGEVLSADGFARAAGFLRERARPLERARFEHRFAGAPVDRVLAELDAFRNDDGGFGRALEPDCRSPLSSVLATWTAVQILDELDVPDTHPLVAGAVDWLLDQSVERDGRLVWPFLPPDAQQAPHAPWWDQGDPDKLATTFGGFVVNPGATLTAMLWLRASLVPAAIRERAAEQSRDAILAGLSAQAVNDWVSATHFAECEDVPGRFRAPVVEALSRWLPEVVPGSLAELEGYAVDALEICRPGGPFEEVLRDQLDLAVRHTIAGQDRDGSWAPTWSWFGAHPEHWAIAEREWRGVLTYGRLAQLANRGRLPV